MSAVDHHAVATAFAAILRTARVGAGLSQEKLAEAATLIALTVATRTGAATTDIGRADRGCFGTEANLVHPSQSESPERTQRSWRAYLA
jgi:hypothetical protein